MPELGYSLSSEKFSASDLVRFARRAEEAGLITEDALAEAIVCSPDPEAHIRRIQEATKAGADHVYLHQVGRDQGASSDFMSEKCCRNSRSDLGERPSCYVKSVSHSEDQHTSPQPDR